MNLQTKQNARPIRDVFAWDMPAGTVAVLLDLTKYDGGYTVKELHEDEIQPIDASGEYGTDNDLKRELKGRAMLVSK